MPYCRRGSLFVACALLSPVVHADPQTQLGVIDVTGTNPKQPAAVGVSVITGDELRTRGITDLGAALQIIADATPASGDDAGTAATFPGLLGSREVDDYLLVVDGVPLGSTLVPPFETVDLADVE